MSLVAWAPNGDLACLLQLPQFILEQRNDVSVLHVYSVWTKDYTLTLNWTAAFICLRPSPNFRSLREVSKAARSGSLRPFPANASAILTSTRVCISSLLRGSAVYRKGHDICVSHKGTPSQPYMARLPSGPQ